ncbi:MAG: isocitrate/isopropylmalate dehydrogenase family protein [Candidatus Marsarchaeota archaeon]|nr:isocitrate/isopropylmalate dehydrogenase family protein [Candidatus Marsarchaeota archaeon]
MTKSILYINGDGVGPELMASARSVIDELADVEWVEGQAGYATFKQQGTPLPQATIDSARACDSILFCAVTTPPGIPNYKSAIIALRQELDLYANLRPFRSLPNVPVPFPPLDFAIVRENTEGLYSGIEESDGQRATALRVITRHASERIVKFAFEYAKARKFSRVTLVHKANVLRKTDGLFLEAGREIAKSYARSGISCDDAIVDSVAMRLVKSPQDFQVIATTNLFGDILSDEASALIGGLGVAPSANIGEKHSLFEPVHGSAPDIAGRGIANPTGMLRSAAMMLEHIGCKKEAARLEKAIARAYEQRIVTKDVGGGASTAQMVDAIRANL